MGMEREEEEENNQLVTWVATVAAKTRGVSSSAVAAAAAAVVFALVVRGGGAATDSPKDLPASPRCQRRGEAHHYHIASYRFFTPPPVGMRRYAHPLCPSPHNNGILPFFHAKRAFTQSLPSSFPLLNSPHPTLRPLNCGWTLMRSGGESHRQRRKAGRAPFFASIPPGGGLTD